MEERQVTVDGVTYELGVPFMVIATQNPIEMEGTYPLPEAQRDRFMARRLDGLPERRRPSSQMLDTHGAGLAADDLEPVADATEIAKLIDDRPHVHVVRPGRAATPSTWSPATRQSPDLRLGASPRATLHLIRAARAAAALDDRDYVLPDDVQALAVPVLAHRLLPTAEAQIGRRDTEDIVADIVAQVPVPDDSRSRRSSALVRDALQGLTTRGRSFLAAGDRAFWSRPLVARPDDLLRIAVLLLALPLVSALVVARTRYRLSSERRARVAARRGRPGRAQVTLRLENISRLPTGLLLVEDRVPYVLGLPAAVRARPGRAARPPRGDLHRALRRARPLPARPAVDPAHRPVRHVRAAPLVHRPGHARRHPAGHQLPIVAAGRRVDRQRGEPVARRSPAPARTTPAPASTARATTCAGCTGAPPPGSAS